MFACCAREVTTKAQVNIVMSDKALVKHLQKEVTRLESELKSTGPVAAPDDYSAVLRKKDQQIQKVFFFQHILVISIRFSGLAVSVLGELIKYSRPSKHHIIKIPESYITFFLLNAL